MKDLIIVRGGGDIATGTIYKLVKSGFHVSIPKHSAKSLAKAEKRVYDMLSLKPKYIDEILSTSQDSYEEVIQALFQLEAKGYIKQIHQNLYIKKM